MKRYLKNSIELTLADGTKILAGLPFIDFLYTTNEGEIYHVVQSNEDMRIDLIAYAYLGDSSFWPYIAWYNNIGDPVGECRVGNTLIIPINATNNPHIKAYTYRQ